MTGAGPYPEQFWSRCGVCTALLYRRRLRRNLDVCPECGTYGRVTAPERIRQLVDPGRFTPLPVEPAPTDPLGFVDVLPYPRRLAAARAATGLSEAVLCGTAVFGGHRAVLAVMDVRFLGGSLGCAVGGLVTRAAQRALVDRTPLVLVTASGGARMQEGVLSLLQMAVVSQAVAALRESGLLTVSVVTDPTYGAVAASFATNTDVVVAEAGARMGYAGPRMFRQLAGRDLPEGFQTAESLLRQGQVDLVAERRVLRARLVTLLAAGWAGQRRAGRPAPTRPSAPAPTPAPAPPPAPAPTPAPAPPPDAAPARPVPAPRSAVGSNRPCPAASVAPANAVSAVGADATPPDPWSTVRFARDPGRPTTLDYLAGAFTGFLELHGDRIGADCPAVVGGPALLDGRQVMAIGHQRGHDDAEMVARNFAMASPAGHRKALRLMRLAARLGLPVVTLVDTPGADPGVQAEEQGQAGSIAEIILTMSGLPVPVVAVVTGEGGNGGALALAVADRVLMLRHAVYSVSSPEVCATVLWSDRSAAPSAAQALRLTAPELHRLGVVDVVVAEPPGGAQRDRAAAAELLRRALVAALTPLLDVPGATLVARRRRRLRDYGELGVGPDRPVGVR